MKKTMGRNLFFPSAVSFSVLATFLSASVFAEERVIEEQWVFSDPTVAKIGNSVIGASVDLHYFSNPYEEEYYRNKFNPVSSKEFWKLAGKFEAYIKEKGWNLTRSNNQNYISFKYGFFNVFGITFIGSKSFCLFFKIAKPIAEKINVEDYDMLRYEDEWKQALYKVESANIDLKKFDPLLDASYKNIVGEKAS